MYIDKLKNIDELEIFLKKLNPTTGKYAGRFYKIENNNIKYNFNDIVRAFQKMIRNSPKSIDTAKIIKVIGAIRSLDQKTQDLLDEKETFTKIATFVLELFQNLFFNGNKVLNDIQFANQIVATSVGNYRLLPLQGEVGSVSCRIRGISANSFPTVSDKRSVEFYARSEPRMRNLVAVRGSQEGARMIGPCDYFGNLESPYEDKYTIQIDNGVPAFIRHKMKTASEQSSINQLPNPPTTILQAEWISGDSPKITNINKNILGKSLFEKKGILKITGKTAFELEKFDPTKVDLSAFKARLVKNDIPFQISNKIISPVDDYRVISYMYEPQYAQKQVEDGGGLFLECHSFPQTITPMDKNSVGFVTLAKWAEKDKKKELEVIAVEIPYGYTLIVEEHCIHGDTNLAGMFMMCMTSSHASMQTADTVFLKNSETLQNISLSIKGNNPKSHNNETKDRLALKTPSWMIWNWF